jgi:hypothetical protein
MQSNYQVSTAEPQPEASQNYSGNKDIFTRLLFAAISFHSAAERLETVAG